MESADHILGQRVIHGNLATHTAVMSENRSRNLDEPDSTHIAGSYEACQVTHHTSAKSKHRGIPVKTALNSCGHHIFEHR
ncbi:hypothetical protein D3C72_1878840 [compost metagenome]